MRAEPADPRSTEVHGVLIAWYDMNFTEPLFPSNPLYPLVSLGDC